jgi:prepilin-type processing-associated H-X9-DG protein
VDHEDRLTPNNSVTTFGGGGSLPQDISWCPDHAATDMDTKDLESGKLFAYNTSVGIYHCPADRSTVVDANGNPTTRLRNRSYNMSQSMNGWNDYLVFPVGAPYDHPPFNVLPAWEKLTAIALPNPAQAFVFIDEHPDTLLDSQFGNPAKMWFWYNGMWFDKPADRHNQGANLSFADGHAERWRWVASKSPAWPGQTVTPQEQPDFDRVQSAMKVYDGPAF